MLDSRHPEDSLFFVAEQDYRFYPEDCIASWYEIIEDEEQPWLDENLEESAQEPGGHQPSPSPAEEEDPSPSPEAPEVTGSKIKRRRYHGWTAAQRTTRRAGEVRVSPELREMVQICNRAAMIGRGHLVWFGWCPAGKRKSVPSYASHLLAITKFGAQKMLESMENGILKKGHWDKVLRAWLVERNFQNPKVLGGSFVWPTVGFFQTHLSGCEPGIGARVAQWDQTYIQAGVAPQKPGDKDRWLACWPANEKGGAEWLEKITFYTRRNVWITQCPPDRWWSTDNDWRRLLWNRWWINREGGWVGPEWAAGQKGKGKGKNKNEDEQQSPSPVHKQSPSPVNKWERLVADPDKYEWDKANNCYMPFTILAEQLVVDWDNWDWNGKHTAREWNTRKKNIAMYKRRVFQESEEEQVTKKKLNIS